MNDSVTPQQISAKARELLQKNEGLFIGEAHYLPLAASFIRANRQMFKELGVTTLYIEQGARLFNAHIGGRTCVEEFLKVRPESLKDDPVTANTINAINAAHAAGFRVIAHDSVNLDAWLYALVRQDHWVKSSIATSPRAIDARDDFAAKLIFATRDKGKYLVLGGAAHSGNNVRGRPSGRGLSERLGIPALDFPEHHVFYEREPETSITPEFGSGSFDWILPTPSKLIMREGKRGESTFKVFGESDKAFTSQTTFAFTNDELRTIERYAAKARGEGACTPSSVSKEKPLRDESDILALPSALRGLPVVHPHERR